jgi:hypothetical protein
MSPLGTEGPRWALTRHVRQTGRAIALPFLCRLTQIEHSAIELPHDLATVKSLTITRTRDQDVLPSMHWT